MRSQLVLDGRYRLEERLGAGGMSVVWRAHDEVLDRSVAVKLLSGPHATGPAACRRVRAEAQAAARLWHPHITNVYDYGESTDGSGSLVPYVVMELLPGRTLAQRLAAGALPPGPAMRVCAEVASALAAAHRHGLVHRDVKPSNIMLTPSGAKVVDFGIAAVAGAPELDSAGQLLGTPAYLAPERLVGGEVLPASDVYALGLLIFRVLTGRLPWQAETTTQMISSHMYVEPAALPPIVGVPAEVYDLCRQCLAKDPADRPTAEAAAAVLAHAAGMVAPPDLDETAPVSRPAPVPPAGAQTGGAQTGGAQTGGAQTGGAQTGGVQSGGVAAAGAVDPAEDVPVAAAPNVVRRRRLRATVGAVLAVAVVGSVVTLVGSGDRRDGASAGTIVAPDSAGLGAGAAPRTDGPAAAATASSSAAPGGSPAPAGSAPSGQPSTGPGPVPSATPTPTPEPGQLVNALGGSVRVLCVGKKAQVLGVLLAAGYLITDLDEGPADEVQVVMLSATNESEIKIKCEQGQPVPRIKESPQ